MILTAHPFEGSLDSLATELLIGPFFLTSRTLCALPISHYKLMENWSSQRNTRRSRVLALIPLTVYFGLIRTPRLILPSNRYCRPTFINSQFNRIRKY